VGWRTHRLEPRIGLPWASLLAFVRIAINPRLLSPPLEVDAAWAFVEEWLDQDGAWVPEAGAEHRRLISGLIRAVRPAANQVPDLHLAALALEHGLTVYSFDGDFAAFPGVRWKNPLEPARAR
jgi:toxin-antitoxin system PIN domain toxin